MHLHILSCANCYDSVNCSSNLAIHMRYPAYKLNKQGDSIHPWHTPFPILNQFIVPMSSSRCCFLTCIQVSQEVHNVACYFHLFKNFPQFVVIHIVKGFRVVNEAGVDVFLEFSCFFYDAADVGNFCQHISGSSVFSKSSLYIWKFSVHILLKPSLKDFSITLLACEISMIVW